MRTAMAGAATEASGPKENEAVREHGGATMRPNSVVLQPPHVSRDADHGHRPELRLIQAFAAQLIAEVIGLGGRCKHMRSDEAELHAAVGGLLIALTVRTNLMCHHSRLCAAVHSFQAYATGDEPRGGRGQGMGHENQRLGDSR